MNPSTLPAEELVSLGKTDLHVSPLGLGAWAWGDKMFWGFGKGYDANDTRTAFDTSLQAGINFIDTAEIYGFGRSEKLLGEYKQGVDQTLVIATKFFPMPFRLRRSDLLRALKKSLQRLRMDQVDLYQIHWPPRLRSLDTWAEALAEALEGGYARAAGVSNYSTSQMQRTAAVLERHGLHLASNQVEYHLLNRKVEYQGLLAACREMDITLIAYSPLAMGILTGKYTPENPLPGIRGKRYPVSYLAAVQPLVARLRQIGAAHGDKSPSQVALNWCICKGTVPIPGAKNARQAQENAGGAGWRLTGDEVAELDELSTRIQQAF
jgi:aryl-alcohol dehydrogenase-like predicted oxidoreductase